MERDSIKDYISEAENLSTLHGNLKRCDEYLLKLEEVSAPTQGASELGFAPVKPHSCAETGAFSKELGRYFEGNSRVAE